MISIFRKLLEDEDFIPFHYDSAYLSAFRGWRSRLLIFS